MIIIDFPFFNKYFQNSLDFRILRVCDYSFHVSATIDLPSSDISGCKPSNSFRASQLTVSVFRGCYFYAPVFVNV